MLYSDGTFSTIASGYMSFKSGWSAWQEERRGTKKSTEGADGPGSAPFCMGIIQNARAEILVSVRKISILELEQNSGTSFSNDIITIVRDPELDLNLLNTKRNHVERCRFRNASVVGSSIRK